MTFFTTYGNEGIKEKIWRFEYQPYQKPVYKNKNKYGLAKKMPLQNGI